MYETITLLYRYNSWAMRTMFDALEKLNPEQYMAPGCSGHGSIKDTLAHMLSVQWGWFSWFDGSLPLDKSKAVKLKDSEISSSKEARKKWEAIDEKTRLFLEIQTEESLKVHRSFTTHSGNSASLPLGEMLLHIANHATHTRAQIVSAIRRAGIAPGNYELLRFLLTAKTANVT